MVDEVRRAAWDSVNAATIGGELFSDLSLDGNDAIDGPGRARAWRLAHETLRWAQRADRVLGPYLRQRPDERIHNLLRMAVFELLAEGGAPHGVVNAAVALAKSNRETVRQAGLVNAVLRRVASGEVDWDALPIPQTPKWLRKRLVAAYGKATTEAIEAAHATRPPMDLTKKSDADDALAERLGAEVLPTGSFRLREPGQVTTLPGYDDGSWWVQDAAAAIPARLLATQPDERVLDMCAAPGGKTMQICDTGANVTALDRSEERMLRLRDNLARTRLSADIVVADAEEWTPDAPFDAILLDAPCSATGTIRRHPDLPFAKDGSGLDALCEAQSRLIDCALSMLKPEGRLVYCVCSLLPEEGEHQLDTALARHPGLSVTPPSLDGIDPAWITDAGGLRLRPDYWPDRGGMDGFFIATLRKPAEAPS